MLLRLALALSLSVSLVHACDCIDVGAGESKRGADIVFRGTVTGFRDSVKGDRLVVFRVNRVWKGTIKQSFEMLALESGHACFGFGHGFLRVGNELLVFGSTFGSDKIQEFPYLSMHCATKLAKDAKDIQQLGRGRNPKPM